jgi:putative endonuclease
MLNRQQQFGKYSERLAVEYLKLKGYRIVETNYRSSQGEIDIIARDKDTLVFVEVKARHSRRFGSAKGAVTPAKQRKISMAALTYLKKHRAMQSRARFDVVTIQTVNGKASIEVIANAFELAYS